MESCLLLALGFAVTFAFRQRKRKKTSTSYTPSYYKIQDMATLESFITKNTFGDFITVKDNTPVVSHLPFTYHKNEGTHGKGLLFTHVALANHIHRDLDGKNVLVVFWGPHAYISPKFYGEKRKADVPTWNYAVVHCYGKARIIRDQKRFHQFLDELVDINEQQLRGDDQSEWWRLSDIPMSLTEKLMKIIVGIEIDIEEMVGKFKLGQNKRRDEQEELVKNLEQFGFSDLAEVTRQTLHIK